MEGVAIFNLIDIATKNLVYDDLSHNTKVDLANLVGISNLESALQNLIKTEAQGLARVVWIKIKNYLAALQKFKITAIGEINIPFLATKANKIDSYDELSNEIKAELANLVNIPTWETTFENFLTPLKAQMAWTKIKTNYLDEIQVFALKKIKNVDIAYLHGYLESEEFTQADPYDGLAATIKGELISLVTLHQDWETVLEALIITKPAGLARLAWTKIKLHYLADLKKLKIGIVEEVEIHELILNADQALFYDGLGWEIQSKLTELVALEDWESKLVAAINTVKLEKTKTAWDTIKTSYLADLQLLKITKIKTVVISELQTKGDASTAYDDLSDEIKTELENLVVLSNWEQTLKDLIAKVKKMTAAWMIIKTSYLADLQLLKITKIKTVVISELQTKGDASTAYDDLSDEIKTELENLVVLPNWEQTLKDLIAKVKKMKAAWMIIKTSYLDDLQLLKITKIKTVIISELQTKGDASIAYDDLSDEIKAELENLVVLPNWEATLKTLIIKVAKMRVAWKTIKTSHLVYIQFHQINQIETVDIPQLQTKGDASTIYDDLSDEIKVELENLVTLTSWEESLKALINKLEQMKSAWMIIKTSYLANLQLLKINQIKTVAILQLQTNGNPATAYPDLSDGIKAELENLVALANWETVLPTEIKNKKIEIAWQFLKPKITFLKTHQITIIADKKIDLILKEHQANGDYDDLSSQAKTQLEKLLTLNNYQTKINALIEANTSKEEEKKFPLAIVLGVTLPIVFLIAIIIGYFLFKRSKLKKGQ